MSIDSGIKSQASASSVTSVASSLSSVTLLVANDDRLRATIVNDSNSRLFVKLGATASATSHTVRLSPHATYHVPADYTGIIDGIWAPNVSGSARITELTP